ncbi:hypothetical protein FOZ63_012101, partial [Perkinsus olseni]
GWASSEQLALHFDNPVECSTNKVKVNTEQAVTITKGSTRSTDRTDLDAKENGLRKDTDGYGDATSSSLRMSHLITPLLLAFLYEVAAFPPNKLYVSKAREFRTAWYFSPDGILDAMTVTPKSRFPFPIYFSGIIPWKADHCGIVLNLDTSNKNFKAFARKFDLKVEDWENIPYDPFEDTFTILYEGRHIVLRPSTEPFPP